MNLYQKLVEVRKVANGFSKDKKSFGYEYVSGNQILNKIKDKMNELNLVLLPSTQLGEHHTHEYQNSKGQDKIDFVVTGQMAYTWINGDNPEETHTVTWAYYGQQDDISKAFGSALTYSERYFLLKSLGLPTDDDDPDSKDTTGNKPKNTNKSTLTPTKIDSVKVKTIRDLATSKNVEESFICNFYKRNKFEEMTIEQWTKAMEWLKKK